MKQHCSIPGDWKRENETQHQNSFKLPSSNLPYTMLSCLIWEKKEERDQMKKFSL
jgi:hypothetical protein